MKSVLQHVRGHAENTPDRLCVRTVSRRNPEQERTFGEVYAASQRAAAFLASQGVEHGDVVVLIGTHHVDLYATWLGCVWVSAVPTVMAEPSVRVDKQIYWQRLAALLERIEGKLLAVEPQLEVSSEWPSHMSHFTYEEIAAGTGGAAPEPVDARPEDLLLLQHSSGTTGLQKGVMLSHGAVAEHAEAYHEALRLTADDVIVSWLPLYHDMGFIACFVDALIDGIPVIWLSPFEWVASPALLLEAATEHKATLAWLPNFAYAFLAKRVRAEPGTYDLSSLRAVVNCSEPVTAGAMDGFAERFAADGFRPTALHACYAMAENVFAVTTSTDKKPPRRLRIDRELWQREHRAEPVEVGDLVHVSNGHPISGCEVKIAADSSKEMAPLHAGRVLIRSACLFDGYFRRDDLNQQLFDEDGFYDTGDLGYVDELGHVYVTGRRKDLIIVGGRNVYPQDVETAVAEIEGIHPGRVVCFGVVAPALGTEALVILAESDDEPEHWKQLAREVRRMVPVRLDLDVADARVVERGELRKSTSGKLARDGNREWYLEGRFGPVLAHLRE